jgi:hypothetical protein
MYFAFSARLPVGASVEAEQWSFFFGPRLAGLQSGFLPLRTVAATPVFGGAPAIDPQITEHFHE